MQVVSGTSADASDTDEDEIIHAPLWLLQAALLSPDFLSLLTAQRGAVLTLRSAATCHAFRDAAADTPDALWQAACQRWALVSSTDWPQSWKVTYRQQLLSREFSPASEDISQLGIENRLLRLLERHNTDVDFWHRQSMSGINTDHVWDQHLPEDASPSHYELGLFLHDPTDGRSQAVWSPMTDLSADTVMARCWRGGRQASGFAAQTLGAPPVFTRLKIGVRIRRKENGKVLATCVGESMAEGEYCFMWEFFGLWLEEEQYTNVLFNVDLVHLPDGLAGLSERIAVEAMDDDEEDGEDEERGWDDAYFELIIYNDNGGKWARTADVLLKFLASKELSVCWI